MGLNAKFREKYDKAYEGLQATITPIYFEETSPYYHMEEWRDVLPMFVPGVLPGVYKVSSYGRVYSSKKKSPDGMLTPTFNTRGYLLVPLQLVDGAHTSVRVHRLVMLHFKFVPGCHLLEIDHLDCNKTNNCLWNLEWVTPQENTHRAINNKLRDLSNSVQTGTLLTNEQCKELYEKALAYGKENYDILAKEYNVKVNYIKGLVQGYIRPYIAGKFYNRLHIE